MQQAAKKEARLSKWPSEWQSAKEAHYIAAEDGGAHTNML